MSGYNVLIVLVAAILLAAFSWTITPRGKHQTLIRSSVLLSITCCYLMWSITYMAQLHPLIGERPQSTALEKLDHIVIPRLSNSTEERRRAFRGNTELEWWMGILAVVYHLPPVLSSPRNTTERFITFASFTSSAYSPHALSLKKRSSSIHKRVSYSPTAAHTIY